jgi:hypothetical protein
MGGFLRGLCVGLGVCVAAVCAVEVGFEELVKRYPGVFSQIAEQLDRKDLSHLAQCSKACNEVVNREWNHRLETYRAKFGSDDSLLIYLSKHDLLGVFAEVSRAYCEEGTFVLAGKLELLKTLTLSSAPSAPSTTGWAVYPHLREAEVAPVVVGDSAPHAH